MINILVLLLAGLGAGIVTGLVGASAVMVATPLLIIFLNYPAYSAIGIALSIDVFSSLFATLVYYKHKRIKIKSSLILLVSSLVAVLIGSFFSKNIPSENLSLDIGIGIIFIGFFLIIKKEKNISLKKHIPFFEKYKTISLILVGLLIGTIAGVFGAGGGIMILLSLVIILDYKTHEAVGTSVFLMIFIALFGGVAHYINMPFSIISILIGAAGGIIGAIFASKLANLLSEETLNRLIGITISILGVLLVLKDLIFK